MTASRILVAMLATFLFGGWAGYTIKGAAADAAAGKQAQAAVKQSAQNVVVSIAESGRIEKEVAQVAGNVTSIKAAIAKRGVTLKPKLKPKDATVPDHDAVAGGSGQFNQSATSEGAQTAIAAQAACPGSSDFLLDVGTVRLLNAARQGRGVGAAGGSDEEKSAPSSVGVTDLIGNDLDIVQMYLDLAKRHDELVDAVEKHLKEQAR